MTAALRVLTPGLMTTLQDLGRPGYQSLGVPVSGALDCVGLAAANVLVGNPPDAAALEIAYQGPAFAVEAAGARIALAGAQTSIRIEQPNHEPRTLTALQSVRVTRGQIVRIGALTGSAVAYLAVEGGFDVPPVLGSRSTYTRAAIGGFEGRALRAGDVLRLNLADAAEREEQMLHALDLAPPPRIRVVLGPQDDYFTEEARRTFLAAPYTVTPASDRMGQRLDGPPLAHARGFNIISDGIAPGAIQVPGNGLPIILLADRQTTGGYPKIATVISADLPPLGRLAPGAKIAFEAVGIDAAEAARRQLAQLIDGLPQRLEPVRRTASIDAAKLLSANLVSGMVDARE